MKGRSSTVGRLLSLLPAALRQLRTDRRRRPQARRLAAEPLERRWLLAGDPVGGLGSARGEADGLPPSFAAGAESEIEAALRLVTSPFAADRMSDANFESYVSVNAVAPNSTFYAEVWLRDRGTIRGIAGGTVDLAYTTAHADANAINHGSIFNVLTSGTLDDPNGLVDNLGGGTFNSGEGTAQWVRLVTTTFQSGGAGATTFTLGHDLPPGAANPTFAEVGAGNINDWNLIQFNGTPATVTSRVTLSDDIVGRNQYGYLWVAKSNGVDAFTSSIWGQWSTARTWSNVMAGNFNGDGHDDVVARNEFGYWWVAASNGSNGFTSSIWGKWDPTRTWTNVMAGDFNGDGCDDLVGRNQFGYWWGAASNGNGSFTSSIWGKWDTARTWTNVMVGDFNKDGCSDLVARNEFGYWWVAASNGSNGFNSSIWGKWDPARTWTNVMVGDFNADGADDLVGRNQLGYWWVAASNGSSTLSNAIWGQWSTARTWKDVMVGDFDGNGADDVVGRNDYGYWWVAKSNGSNALANGIWGKWDSTWNWTNVKVGDFNCDGNDDVVARDKSNYWWVEKSNGWDKFAHEYWGKWNAVDWFDVLDGDFGG